MRILYLANNRLGLDILRWLRSRGENIVGLVIHPPPRQRLAEEITLEAALPPESVFLGSSLQVVEVLRTIESLKPELALSINFGYVLQPPLLEVIGGNAINLHTGYLPFNRGAHPNVWSIVEGTPAGVTLHYIDAGIDTGDIIAQQEVIVEPVDTGLTLYGKLEQAARDLFSRTWPRIQSGSAPRRPQHNQSGTFHRAADLRRVEKIDLDRHYLASDLINLLRARTFPPFGSAFFVAHGRRVSVRLELEYEVGGEALSPELD